MEEKDLSSEEEFIKQNFLNLIEEVGYSWYFTFQKYQASLNFCIYKENGQWHAFMKEKDNKSRHSVFEYLYDLCMFLFTLLPCDKRNYCLEVFPLLIEKEEKKKIKHI